MNIFNFRIRFIKSPRTTIEINEKEFLLPKRDKDPDILLLSRDNKTIKDDLCLVVKSSGWKNVNDAYSAGKYYLDAITRTLVRLRIGADFGKRSPISVFTDYGLKLFQESEERPLMNDVHGLMVYKSDKEKTPQFLSAKADLIRGIQNQQFIRLFEYNINNNREISEREQVSIELFNSSFFQKSEDARFLLLMCSLEAHVDIEQQSEKIISHIKNLISITDGADDLSKNEKNNLKGSLGHLSNLSIGQSGRKLVKEKLGARLYMNMSSTDFFNHCYRLRSRLIHGETPMPSLNDVSSAAADLELMVSDLISYDLLDSFPLT